MTLADPITPYHSETGLSACIDSLGDFDPWLDARESLFPVPDLGMYAGWEKTVPQPAVLLIDGFSLMDLVHLHENYYPI